MSNGTEGLDRWVFAVLIFFVPLFWLCYSTVISTRQARALTIIVNFLCFPDRCSFIQEGCLRFSSVAKPGQPAVFLQTPAARTRPSPSGSRWQHYRQKTTCIWNRCFILCLHLLHFAPSLITSTSGSTVIHNRSPQKSVPLWSYKCSRSGSLWSDDHNHCSCCSFPYRE